MIDLSSAAIIEKNKLASDGAWLILLMITLSNGEIIRVLRNTEDITWNGETWQAFPFELDDLREEGGGEHGILTVRVSNVSRALMPYIEESRGLVGCTVNLYVVHSGYLELTNPEVNEEFIITKTSADAFWITFELSAASLFNIQFPTRRYLKNWCGHVFKDVRCGYTGDEYLDCDKTLAACRERGNSARFGGFPGIPQGGVYATY